MTGFGSRNTGSVSDVRLCLVLADSLRKSITGHEYRIPDRTGPYVSTWIVSSLSKEHKLARTGDFKLRFNMSHLCNIKYHCHCKIKIRISTSGINPKIPCYRCH